MGRPLNMILPVDLSITTSASTVNTIAGSSQGFAEGTGSNAKFNILPSNGTATCKLVGKFDPTDPSTCTASCVTGYNANDGSTTYTCDDTGSWSGGSLVCTPKPCDGNPTGAEGGDNYDPNVQACTGKFDGSGCDASCYPRYTPSGEAHYTCANADGRKQPAPING